MEVTAASSAAPLAGAATDRETTPAAAAAINYDAFLKLLVAEMSNQDPTEPMDSTEYVAQLASFSQVEQSIQTNTKLDDLLTRSTLSLAGSLIGRTLTSPDGAQSGTISSVRFSPSGPLALLSDGSEVSLQSGISIS